MRYRTEEDILPIDRGYAWVTVAAGSLLFGLSAGGYKCQGIILVELTERFPDIPTPAILWVFNLVAILSVVAPAITILSYKFGYRLVIMLGLLMCAAAHIGLGYAQNLATMVLAYGIPMGIGGTAVYMLSLIAPAPYFNKKQAFAIGLVASGSGFGTTAIPYILRALFDNYDFSGAMLLFAGFILNFLCLASLLRPMSYFKNLYKDELELLQENKQKVQDSDNGGLGSKEKEAIGTNCTTDELQAKDTVDERAKESAGYNKAEDSIQFLPSDKIEEGELDNGAEEDSDTNGSKCWSNWMIVFDPKMMMFTASFLIHCMGNLVVYTYLPSLAAESQVAKSTVALVLMVVGSLEVPFRAANGYLADRHVMTAYAQYMIGLTTAGGTVLAGTLLSGVQGLVVTLLGMSICGTSIFSLTPVVLMELLGKDKLDYAMGIQLATQGTATIATTFLSGFIHNSTHSWKMVFLYISGCMITGGLMLFPYWLIKQLAAKRDRNDTTVE